MVKGNDWIREWVREEINFITHQIEKKIYQHRDPLVIYRNKKRSGRIEVSSRDDANSNLIQLAKILIKHFKLEGSELMGLIYAFHTTVSHPKFNGFGGDKSYLHFHAFSVFQSDMLLRKRYLTVLDDMIGDNEKFVYLSEVNADEISEKKLCQNPFFVS